jgi:hypothetical protein
MTMKQVRYSLDDTYSPRITMLAGPASHTSICIGCGQEIFDRYILRVAPDLEWHAACLRVGTVGVHGTDTHGAVYSVPTVIVN